MPIAGFYFPRTRTRADRTAYAAPGAWPATYALWQAYADESCVAARASEPWVCMLANGSFPFVTSPTFAVEAQTDQVVLLDHDDVPPEWLGQPPEQAYLAEWHANMTVALAPLMAADDAAHGVFNPACFIHTDFSPQAPLIGGVNYVTALRNYYFKRTPPSAYKLADDCGIMCNPTCPK